MIELVKNHIIPVALSFLPDKMNSTEAVAMLLAVGFQESGFEHRRQIPVAHARGFWQFERGGGVKGVATHEATAAHVAEVLAKLKYPKDEDIYLAITHNDILAAAIARLLLWTAPHRLPTSSEPELGWNMYQEAWRPGKPKPEKWGGNFKKAWELCQDH